ncbi:hypothetical protein BH18VER1_BH18VER1_12180 [soil metagenome]
MNAASLAMKTRSWAGERTAPAVLVIAFCDHELHPFGRSGCVALLVKVRFSRMPKPARLEPCAPQAISMSRLQQRIRIDVDCCHHVFGQRQLVERFADEPAQAHDRFAAQQNVKPELALELFERRGRG